MSALRYSIQRQSTLVDARSSLDENPERSGHRGMKSVKISVIVPTFNVAPYIAQTLESIRRQDYTPLEVIVVDGNSTDDTVQIARRFGGLITQLISEPDRGQLDALQKGLSIATGDIFYWVNGDDIVMPGTFHHVAKTFAQRPDVDYVFSDDFAFDEDAQRLYVGGHIRGLCYHDQILAYRQMFSECVFWRRKINKLLPETDFDLRVYTDYAFFLNIIKGRKGLWVSKRLGAFRIRSGQASSAFAQRKATEFHRIRETHLGPMFASRRRAAMVRSFYYLWFFPRQIVRPYAVAGMRKLWRALTGDRQRRQLATFFFGDWIARRG